MSKSFDKQVEVISKNLVVEGRFTTRWNDEPKLFLYESKYRKGLFEGDSNEDERYGNGTSFKKKTAYTKSILESAERYCLENYKSSEFTYSTRQDLKGDALDLKQVTRFDDTLIRKFPDLNITTDSKFYWTKGTNLGNNNNILIPAQLVYVPYETKGEQIIRYPISTGAALGADRSDAILRGIFEVLERDAFAVYYLNNLHGELIDYEGNKQLKEISDYFHKYRLKIYLVNLPTDVTVHNIMAILIDDTLFGPKISVGCKTGLDPLKVAIGAIEEAFQVRIWIKETIVNMKTYDEFIIRLKKDPYLLTIENRGLLWAQTSMLEFIRPWIDNTKHINFKSLKSLTKKDISVELDYLLEELKKNNHNVYYVDVTTDKVAEASFCVVKVIIPTMHPIHLDEKYRYLGGTRLYELPVKLGLIGFPNLSSNLNNIPHFFL